MAITIPYFSYHVNRNYVKSLNYIKKTVTPTLLADNSLITFYIINIYTLINTYKNYMYLLDHSY